MVTSTITARLPYPPALVWEAVTQVDRYPLWRSDLAGIDLPQEGTFVEHSREGIATRFTVTCADPCRRWEFSLENQRITGRWTGLFSPWEKGTQVTFTTEKDAAPTPGRDRQASPQPSQSESAQETCIGNLNSKVFHREDCPNLPAEQNRVVFSSREEAVEEGYSPCGNCKP